jgi:hypothetical protein
VLISGKGGDASPRVPRHTPAVLDAIARLAASGRHPQWRDVNLGATLPGWSRVEAAEAWLNRASARRKELLKVGGQDEAPAARKPARPAVQSAPQRKSPAPAPAPQLKAEAALPQGNAATAEPQRKAELAAPQRKKLYDDFEAWARKAATREPAVK